MPSSNQLACPPPLLQTTSSYLLCCRHWPVARQLASQLAPGNSTPANGLLHRSSCSLEDSFRSVPSMPDAARDIAVETVRTGAWHLVQVRTRGPCGCKASKCLQPAAQDLFLQVCAWAKLLCGTSIPDWCNMVPTVPLGQRQYLVDVQAAERFLWVCSLSRCDDQRLCACRSSGSCQYSLWHRNCWQPVMNMQTL